MSSFTVAVSDGASSSVFARQWARLLVNDFARGPFPPAPDANERVTLLGRKWRQQVEAGPLPWYAQEKLVQGSHASLLVVTWDLQGQRTFSARAIGDSCLFVIRDDALHHAFPVTKSSEFGNHPTLLSTELGRASSDGAGVAPLPPPTFAALDRPYEPGDRFLLMTDALAGWFLAEYEAAASPGTICRPSKRPSVPGFRPARQRGHEKRRRNLARVVRAAGNSARLTSRFRLDRKKQESAARDTKRHSRFGIFCGAGGSPIMRRLLPLLSRFVAAPLICCCAAALPALSGAVALAQPAARAETEAAVRLRHALPSDVARLLIAPSPSVYAGRDRQQSRNPDGTLETVPASTLLPPGVTSVAPDDARHLLRVRGDRDGVAQFRDLVRLMDVPRRAVRLQFRLVSSGNHSSAERRSRTPDYRPLLGNRSSDGNDVPASVTLRAPGVGDFVAGRAAPHQRRRFGDADAGSGSANDPFEDVTPAPPRSAGAIPRSPGAAWRSVVPNDIRHRNHARARANASAIAEAPAGSRSAQDPKTGPGQPWPGPSSYACRRAVGHTEA
jgi:hypothetical protein